MSAIQKVLQPVNREVSQKLRKYFDLSQKLLVFSDTIINELDKLKLKQDS